MHNFPNKKSVDFSSFIKIKYSKQSALSHKYLLVTMLTAALLLTGSDHNWAINRVYVLLMKGTNICVMNVGVSITRFRCLF